MFNVATGSIFYYLAKKWLNILFSSKNGAINIITAQ